MGVLSELGSDTLTVDEKVERVVAFYVPMLRHRHPDDFPKREKDLEHFMTIAARYRSLESLLADMALEPPNDSVGDVLAATVDEGTLTLSTIHSAKGLEFHSVFIIHALDGVLPSGYAFKDEDALDEELRLFYVAITRAEENLFISLSLIHI